MNNDNLWDNAGLKSFALRQKEQRRGRNQDGL